MKVPFWRNRLPQVPLQELKTEAPQTFIASAKSVKPKRQLLPQRENFEYPGICLWEIKRAVATDSYISESLNKYKEKIFKAGYQLRGDQESLDYIKKRLELMNFMNDTILDVLFQEIADDLITYCNAFLLKNRIEDIPFINAKGFFNDNPVGGYTRLDPCNVIIVKDKFGNIVRYELEGDYGENQKIQKTEIIHFYINRKANESYGTPRLEPVLEDVKALREIEGNVLALVHRFCFPLYHVKVGLPTTGYAGTTADIDVVKREIETMNEDGMLITNEKVEVKVIGAENNALDLMNYLKYFENRVFSGINTSETQMGRDNNSNPDTLENQIHDSVKHIQHAFSLFIENHIFGELLLEGGFNPVLTPDQKVNFIFNEISLDTKVKLENHEMLKYQSNVQSLDETRQNMGRTEPPVKEDFYVENVTNQSAIIQIDAKNEGALELAREQARLAPKTTPGSSTGQKKNNQGNGKVVKKQTKDVASRNRPQNQHGSYSVKIKEMLIESSEKSKNEQEIYDRSYKMYNKMRNEILDKGDYEYFSIGSEKFKEDLLELMNIKYDLARIYYQKSYSHKPAKSMAENEITPDDFKIKGEEAIDHFISELRVSLREENHKFDTWEYRLKFILNYWSVKFFWYCFIQMAKVQGVKKLYIHFSRKEEKENRLEVIDTNSYKLSDIPPFHPFCKCELHLSKKGAV